MLIDWSHLYQQVSTCSDVQKFKLKSPTKEFCPIKVRGSLFDGFGILSYQHHNYIHFGRWGRGGEGRGGHGAHNNWGDIKVTKMHQFTISGYKYTTFTQQK
jgi:hypothetical protein